MNRQIRIFSTKDDEYLKDFKEVALELNLKILIYHYERFSFADNRLTYTGRKDFPKFSDQDSVLFRRPSYDKQKQHFWVRLLATLARDAGSKVINPDFMVNFPLHSGKLFQAAYFSAYDIPHVPTYRLDRKLKNLDFPMIIKKRYSAYGHGTCLVESNAEFNEARSRIAGKGDYIVQKFYPLKRDVRVMVLNNQVIGSVQRQPHIHADTKYVGSVDSYPGWSTRFLAFCSRSSYLYLVNRIRRRGIYLHCRQ